MGRYDRTCEEFAAHRLHSPPSDHGCKLCRGPLRNQSYSTCYLCGRHSEYLNGHELDYYYPVSLAFDDGQFYQDLITYKTAGASALQQQIKMDLTIVLHKSLKENKDIWLGEPRPDLVSWIPSTRRDNDSMEWITRKVYKTATALLRATGQEVKRREPDLSRFEVLDDVDGCSVMLLDDLFTSGSHLFSAAGILKEAGAQRVGAVTLGRFVRAEESPDFKRQAQSRPFSWRWSSLESDWLF